MSVQIQTRRGTTALWATTNPVLADGEQGFDTSSRSMKVGNGVAAWNDLPFLNAADLALKANVSNPVFEGIAKTHHLFIDRLGHAASGINWYSGNYNSWVTYMGPAGITGQGPCGALTPAAGALVSSWGMRSFIENGAGFGWVFESGLSADTVPAIMAEISSQDGAAKFAGPLTAPRVNTGNINWPSYVAILDGGSAQYLKAGGLVASHTYKDNAPTNGIFSRGQIQSGVPNGTAPFIVESSTRVERLQADSASKLVAVDLRSVTNPIAQIGYTRSAKFRFGTLTEAGGADYADVIDMSGWTDDTGGGINSLYFAKNAQRILHKWVPAGGTAWKTREVYHQGSILGIVSHAGGVPTGAIIESGSNSAGQYVRFADGTQICTLTAAMPSQPANTGTSVYCPLPAAFINSSFKYTVACTGSINGNGNQDSPGALMANGIYKGGTDAWSLTLACWAYRYTTSTDTALDITVTGRWF